MRSFDYTIGSGIAPGLLHRAGLRLSVFFPYSIGVEFYRATDFVPRLITAKASTRALLTWASSVQAAGIKRTVAVACGDSGPTLEALVSLGVKPRMISFPMVYHKRCSNTAMPANLQPLRDHLAQFRFKVVHHSRLLYVRPSSHSDRAWEMENKNNDWAIRGFAEFVHKTPDCSAVMAVLEYGRDVVATKSLVKELNVQDHVVFVPLQPRRNLMKLLEMCDAAFGQFLTTHASIWGGVGWEILAAGKPFIQGYRFDEGQFESIFGTPEPPVLKVLKPSDVAVHLDRLYNRPDEAAAVSRDTADWFDAHHGVALASRWIDMLRELPSQRRTQAAELPR